MYRTALSRLGIISRVFVPIFVPGLALFGLGTLIGLIRGRPGPRPGTFALLLSTYFRFFLLLLVDSASSGSEFGPIGLFLDTLLREEFSRPEMKSSSLELSSGLGASSKSESFSLSLSSTSVSTVSKCSTGMFSLGISSVLTIFSELLIFSDSRFLGCCGFSLAVSLSESSVELKVLRKSVISFEALDSAAFIDSAREPYDLLFFFGFDCLLFELGIWYETRFERRLLDRLIPSSSGSLSSNSFSFAIPGKRL